MFSIVLFSSCITAIENELSYDFTNPQLKIELPRELNEISGLHWKKADELWAINDEKGIIYLLNVDSGKIINRVKFKKKGDFEGITKVGGHFYALKSNGTLMKVKNEKSTSKELFKKGYEFEGLCYSPSRNSLLLACKEHKKSSKNKFIWIFEYDLLHEELKEEPFLKIEKRDIGEEFKPSGIAIHPNGNIYITSGVSGQILQVDQTLQKIKMAQLDREGFPQLEGICFNDEGELYLATEKALLQQAIIYKFGIHE